VITSLSVEWNAALELSVTELPSGIDATGLNGVAE